MDTDDILDFIGNLDKSNSRLFADQLLVALRRARARIQELEKEIVELQAQVQAKQAEIDKIDAEIGKKKARVAELKKQLEEDRGDETSE